MKLGLPDPHLYFQAPGTGLRVDGIDEDLFFREEVGEDPEVAKAEEAINKRAVRK